MEAPAGSAFRRSIFICYIEPGCARGGGSAASVGLPVDEDSDAIKMFRMVLAEGRSLISQRQTIEQRAVALLSDNTDYQLLRTITGIGPINALTILAEAGDLRRFVITVSF